MERKENHTIINQSNRFYITIGGIALIVIGALILLDRWLKTGWLALAALPLMGILFLIRGIRTRELKMIIPGAILSGLGLGIIIFLGFIFETSWTNRIGLGLLAFGMGWLLVPMLTLQYSNQTAWWALVPGGLICGLGAFFIYSPMRPLDLVLYLSVSLGLVFLIWGIACHLFRLIIPGCLLITIGPSIYLAWGTPGDQNILTRTGIMLVGFALGWLLITILSRTITSKFIWWPLIPGGVLAMVGWGVYIAGNPNNAAIFISNTGSIGLILFGIYLLLLRKGIQG